MLKTLERRRFVMIGLIYLAFNASFSQASSTPPGLEGVGVTEHLGDQIQFQGLQFVDDTGQKVEFEDYFHKGTPVLFAMVYYGCPHLCNMVLNGLVDSLKEFDWTVGKEFSVVAVSINPEEKFELAQKKKSNYIQSYARPQSETGWHFLTGEELPIVNLANQVGFGFRYDESEKQYAHAAVIFLLTPDGKIARYLYGVKFDPSSLRLSLLEASRGKIVAAVERMLLFCFHFDPSKNSYVFKVWRVVQVVLFIQAMIVFLVIFLMWKKDRDLKLPR